MSAALRELLAKAKFGEFSVSGTGFLLEGKHMFGDGVYGDAAPALAALINEAPALLAKSAAYDALVAEIARAPVGKVEVYDTPEQWRYVIVPDHFDSGQRVRLLVSDDRPSHTAGDGNG